MENTQHYKKLLEEKKASLIQQLEGLGRKLNENGDWMAVPNEEDGFRADKNENADDVEGFEENIATLNALEEQYNDVVSALQRIEDGTYGICKVSGKEIEKERLDANPAADTCIEHKDQ